MTADLPQPLARTNDLHRMTEPAVTEPDPGLYLRHWGLQAPAYESGSGGGAVEAIAALLSIDRLHQGTILAPVAAWLRLPGSGGSWPLHILVRAVRSTTSGSSRFDRGFGRTNGTSEASRLARRQSRRAWHRRGHGHVVTVTQPVRVTVVTARTGPHGARGGPSRGRSRRPRRSRRKLGGGIRGHLTPNRLGR